MTKRTAVLAADLYVLLQREFRRRQAPECKMCYVQLPYRVDRRDPGTANWEVVPPPTCAFDCWKVLEDLVAEFQALYDLRTDETRS